MTADMGLIVTFLIQYTIIMVEIVGKEVYLQQKESGSPASSHCSETEGGFCRI